VPIIAPCATTCQQAFMARATIAEQRPSSVGRWRTSAWSPHAPTPEPLGAAASRRSRARCVRRSHGIGRRPDRSGSPIGRAARATRQDGVRASP
jgi:hypothetical protein